MQDFEMGDSKKYLDEAAGKMSGAVEAASERFMDIKEFLGSKTFNDHITLLKESSSCHAESLRKHFGSMSEKASLHAQTIGQEIPRLPQHPHFKEFVYAVLFLIVATVALTNYFIRLRNQRMTRASTPTTPQLEKAPSSLRDKLKAPDREPGGEFPNPRTHFLY